MIGKIEDTRPQTQEPRPAPLGRAPVQFVLVVVVVQLLWRRAFSIFVDVARRPAHFLWCVSSVSRVVRVASAAFARRQSCSKSRLCCLALHSDAFATRRLFAATDLAIMEAREVRTCCLCAGQPRVLYAHQLMAKWAVLEAFRYGSRGVRTAGEALEKRLPRLLIVRASATTH